jgi:putative copper export protein
LRNRCLVRFSRLGLVGVVVIAASGGVQTVLEVGSWAALFGTPYGVGVLIKIGLLAAMLGLAGLNTWRFRKDGAALSRGVQIELALGVITLAVAAVLTGTAPARQAG